MTIKDELNDVKEELLWWKGYAHGIEYCFSYIRDIINESQGVIGYHLNGEIATWDELLKDSMFEIGEGDIKARKSFPEKQHETSEIRDVFYVKDYKNLPITIQYTPVYGGIKYVRADKKE